MAKKITTSDFIERAKKVHGDRYDYSKVNYTRQNIPVEIICPKHGVFSQRPEKHWIGHRCRKCSIEIKSLKRLKSQEQFEREALSVHPTYDFSKFIYRRDDTKGVVICLAHGEFHITPSNLLRGKGCPKCAKRYIPTAEEYREQMKEERPEYDFSQFVYITAKTKSTVICPIHGPWEVNADNLKQGKGCPKCKISLGEKRILKYLQDSNVQFNSENTFNDCVDIRPLPFDFFLPEYSLCIEYDGIQHFTPVEWFGGIVTFTVVRYHDTLKNEYCRKNDIRLLRIPYWEFDNVEEIIKATLNRIAFDL